MSTVLVIGPNYFNFLSATKGAFERMGWTVVVEGYDNPIHPYTPSMKWRWKLSRNREALQTKSREAYNAFILKRFEELKPDVVFVMNGDILFGSTLDAFRVSAKVALWLFDTRSKLPSSVGHVDHVDALFCYEQDDVDLYASEGKQAYFLPQACDTDTYRPLDLEKDIDILFVGNLYTSPRRMQFMQQVVEHYPDRNIEVWGLYKPWYKGVVRWLFREHRDIYKNRTVSPDEVNRLYNRSRVVLNIHQEQQKEGANPRTFEILGSGAWQVCDGNPCIERMFSADEMGIFHSTDELFACIDEALLHDKTAAALLAREKMLAKHTFDVRMKAVLDVLFDNGS